MPRVSTSPRIATRTLSRFDGGLNLRDAPTELAESETPSCENITLDERGAVSVRLGLVNLTVGSQLPAPPQTLYYSEVADALLAYISTFSGNGRLYKSTNAGVDWTEVTWTPGPPLFTAGAEAAIIDFKDRVVLVNTLDGVYSFPSSLGLPTRTTGGSANMEEVRGSGIAVWQNKLWVVGDIREDATHSKARVWFSNAGSELLWTVASAFVDLRDVDTKICTAIHAGMGQDVAGKPTLLVFKESSWYRINDSTSGAYTTMHSRGAGAANARAVVSLSGRICAINREGIWVTDGLATPQRVSDKIRTLFGPEGLNLATLSSWTAGAHRDRVVFALARNGSSTNNLVLEYHPTVGWVVPHALALGPMTLYTKQSNKLVACRPTGGKIFDVFSGASDDGVAIPFFWQSAWMQLADGDESRLRYSRFTGRGVCSAQLRTNFVTVGEDFACSFDQGFGFVWDVGLWDGSFWGAPATTGQADFAHDDVATYASFVFSGSAAAVAGDLESGLSVGSWGLYTVKLDHIPLGT